MNYTALQDLYLAGVKWEITDMSVPKAIAAAKIAESMPKPAVLAPATPADDIQIPDALRTPVYSSGPVIVPSITPVGPDTAVAAAARPTDPESLKRMIAEFNHPLRATARNTVLPHIAPNPCGLLVITDAPGADDDAAGRVLSGAAGELFDKMIAAIGQSRDTVSISPMLFWRTPGGRAASTGEIDLVRPFVMRLIELLAPRVILTMGTTAATEIAHVDIARAHGVLQQIDGRNIMPIFHPNYLMLKPAAKRDAWTALQAVQNLLKND